SGVVHAHRVDTDQGRPTLHQCLGRRLGQVRVLGGAVPVGARRAVSTCAHEHGPIPQHGIGEDLGADVSLIGRVDDRSGQTGRPVQIQIRQVGPVAVTVGGRLYIGAGGADHRDPSTVVTVAGG